MLKVVISGYGRMGHNVEEILKARGVECAGKSDDIASFDKCLARECVCIDFSTPDAFRRNYRHIASNFRAAVIGTTGWDDIRDEVIGYFERQGTPMVYSSNFSVGVNVLSAAVALIAKRLGQAGGYSPYIVEKHHVHKLDAPSGTAKSLAAVVREGLGQDPGFRASGGGGRNPHGRLRGRKRPHHHRTRGFFPQGFRGGRGRGSCDDRGP